MQHPDEGMIHAWLDGALSAAEAARLEAHLKECPKCAAAVAEARGFIAASSRILTALDDAPRGVIPAARPKRRFDTTMVRIAASVLVVAAGTLVVVRNQGSETRSEASTRDTTSAMRVAGPASTAAAPAPSQSAPIDGLPNAAETGAVALSQKASADNAAAAPTPDPVPTSEQRSDQVAARRDLSKIGTAQGTGVGQTGAGRAGGSEKAPGYKTAPAPAPPVAALPFPTASRVAGVAALDGAVPSESLKVIDTTRRIGTNITVYEVAGDTVTLTESVSMELSSLAVTGAAAAPAAQGAIQVEGSPKRAVTAMGAPRPDSVTRKPTSPPASAIPPASQGRALREAVEAIHTITWSDPATGKTFTLAGKMSEARLQQIRLRIERERAAAAKINR